MTNYTVGVRAGESAAVAAETTDDMEVALDWAMNALEAIMDPKDETTFATLSVNGKTWVVMQEGGVGPDGLEPRILRAAE